MWICPVCDHKNTKNDCCSACGFDRSCSYEEFNTLASIKTGNQSIHLKKMEYRIRKHPDAFVCSKCGGIYFLLLGKDKKPTCANCGAKIAMPSPAVMEKSVAITSTIEKSTTVTGPAASGTKTISPASKKTADGFTPTDNFVPVQNPFPISQQKTLSLLPVIAGGTTHTVARRNDGRVIAIGDDTLQCCSETEGWTDIIAVAAGQFHTVGLKDDGTAVAAGYNFYFYRKETLSQEKNIVAIAVGCNHTVILKRDGTVRAFGRNYDYQCNTTGWKDMIAIAAGYSHSVGLKKDGTVLIAGRQAQISGWCNITAVAAGKNFTVGLKSNGTVRASGDSGYGECSVSGWKNIVAIAAGEHHTVGLRSDGTVVAVGFNWYGQCNVTNWKNIVAIAAGSDHTIGVKADGTVVATGRNSNEQCNVASWKNIQAAPGKPMTANVKPSISAPNKENMSRPLKPTAASSGIYTGTQSRNKTLICKVCGYRYESAGEHLQCPIYCAVCGVRMNPELRDEILRKL